MADAQPRAVEAAWLSIDVLLLVLDGVPGGGSGDAAVGVSLNGAGSLSDVAPHPLPGADAQQAVITAVPMPGRSHLDEAPSLLIQAVGSSIALSAEEVQAVTVDLKTLIRRRLAPLDARTRNAAVDFLATAAMNGRPSIRTAQALLRVRDALRERLQPHENDKELPRGLLVEHILQVDERSFYMKGWAYDDEAEITSLSLVSPEGMRVELLDRIYRDFRPDVAEWAIAFAEKDRGKNVGMICFFELPAPSSLRDPWILEMQNAEGTAVEMSAPPVQTDEPVVRGTILHECLAEVRDTLDEELMTRHVSPAITRIQSKPSAKPVIDSVTNHGPQPEEPEVSIVIPLYRTTEYLEAQFAEFADDPDIRAAELIYVLDSPELEAWVNRLATDLYPIYLVPFRIVVLEKNVGFAGANNAGASVARGRLLLMMNSDVLPDRPGWLSTMREFYDSKPNIGALAAKLVYEDDSIQHAGMSFYKERITGLWLDSQDYRGLHRTFPAANVARPAPAVSGACTMIDKALYDEIGGLSGQYVQGDYEDFDLCLRLLEAGRENWYLPSAELYHLEAQSYTPDLRTAANRYNSWLHTHRWSERIEGLITGYESSQNAPISHSTPQ
jgi:O-antigen biosynthesis protein